MPPLRERDHVLTSTTTAATSTRPLLRHPVVKPVFGVLLVAGAGYTLWHLWGDPSLADIPTDISLAALGVAVLVKLIVAIFSPMLWLAIFRSLGGRVGLRDAYRIYLVTSVAKYLPGKVMLVAARIALLQERGQLASTTFTSTLLELILSLLAAAIITVVCLPLLLWEHGLESFAWFVAMIAFIALPVGLAGLHPRVMGPGLRLVARFLPQRVAQMSTTPPPFGTTMLVLGGNVIARLVGIFGLFAVVRSIVPLDAALLPQLLGVSAASYLFGFVVPIAPAGIGAKEGLMTVLLATMMPAPAAAIISVLNLLTGVVAELIAAGLAILVARTGIVRLDTATQNALQTVAQTRPPVAPAS
jgi:uncharacterized membrane protein YbhN (UPF0104 family)